MFLLQFYVLFRLFCYLQGIRTMTPSPPLADVSTSIETENLIENYKNYKKAKIEKER